MIENTSLICPKSCPRGVLAGTKGGHVGGRPPPRLVLGSVPRHKCRGNSSGSCVECYALSDVRASVTEKQQRIGGQDDQLQLSAMSYQLSANTTFENLMVAGFCNADRPLTQAVLTRPLAHAGGTDSKAAETTIFVYDASGVLIADISRGVSNYEATDLLPTNSYLLWG